MGGVVSSLLGGATSASTTNNTTEDTSQYIFRNSSRMRGYFEGDAGYVDTDDDRSTTADLLSTTEMARLNNNIDTLIASSVDQLATAAGDLQTRASTAWDRATSLYDTFKGLTDDKLADLKAEMLSQIYARQVQWAITAGSSFNCIVQSMTTEAEVDLARRMAGVIADDYAGMVKHETEAMASAFEMELKAQITPIELGLNSLSALMSTLRGSHSAENVSRDVKEVRATGKFGHEAEDWTASNGTYVGEATTLGVAAATVSSAALGAI